MTSLPLIARIWLVRIAFAVARILPARPRVILATSHADRISGNLAFIREELGRRTPPVPVIEHAYRSGGGWRGRLALAWNDVRAAISMGTSRVFIVDDYFFPLYVVRPRAETTIVQTWHASGAFKKFGYDVLEKSFGADERLTGRVRIHGNYDVCLIGSRAAAEHYAGAFRQPIQKFVTHLGIPRTDVLFGAESRALRAEAVRRRYGIPPDRRVVLYAPTFRGDRVSTARFEDHLDLSVMQGMLGEDHHLLIRLHPFVRAGLTIPARCAGFATDVSDHPDINELMLASDVLVTDYSSAIFEYSLLERPMVFFAPDYEAYEQERGFYFDYRTGVPGPVFETTDSLAAYLRAGQFDLDRVRRFRDESFEIADGRSSARVVDELILPALTATTDGRAGGRS